MRHGEFCGGELCKYAVVLNDRVVNVRAGMAASRKHLYQKLRAELSSSIVPAADAAPQVTD